MDIQSGNGMIDGPAGFKPLPSYPKCFVCGKENPHGLRTHWRVRDSMAVCRFTAGEWLGGFADVVHGGIIGALLDEALIWGAYAATGRFGVTAEMAVRYLKPLRIGNACTIEGGLVEDKRRIWLAESRLFLDNGETIAKADGKIRPMTENVSASFDQYLDRRT